MAERIDNPSKYQNLSSTVKSAQKEPTLDIGYIKQVFNDFGYQPVAADVHYWGSMKESQKPQLVKKLQSRRDEQEKAQTEQENKIKESQRIAEERASQGEEQRQQEQENMMVSPKHLSDQQIEALYSEYGLPKPDASWVKKHLPDNEDLLRNILKQEVSHIEAATKIASKQALDAMKNSSANNVLQNTGQGGRGRADGQGGPAPTGSIPDFAKYTDHFVGKHSLVKFQEDPDGPEGFSDKTVWLLDNENSVMRPFMSMAAFNASFKDPADAMNQVVTMPISQIKNGQFAGKFEILNSDYGINSDGSYKDLEVNRSALKDRYGMEYNEGAMVSGVGMLKTFIELNKKDKGSGLESSFLTSLESDASKMAMLTNALAFGGYTMTDLYKELKRQQEVAKGNEFFSTVKIIDPKSTAADYKYSKEGQIANNYPQLTPPAKIGNLDSSQMDYAIFDLPDEAFKLLSPLKDVNSQAFKEEMATIKDLTYDLAQQQIDADTDSAKAIADSNWSKFKEAVETKYGIALKDNAMAAWGQIEQLEKSYSERGLTGSGYQAEAEDELLRGETEKQKRLRDAKKVEKDNAEIDYLKKTATPEEIKKTIEEDMAAGLAQKDWRATQAGLVFSDTDKASLRAMVAAKYPGESEEYINKAVAQIMDENGNKRSILYQSNTDADMKAWVESFNRKQQAILGTDAEKKRLEGLNWTKTGSIAADNESKYSKGMIDTGTGTGAKVTDPEDPTSTVNIDTTKTPAGTDSRGVQKVAFTQWNPVTNEIKASKAGDTYIDSSWELWTGGNIQPNKIGDKLFVPDAIAKVEAAKTPTNPNTPKTLTPPSSVKNDASAPVKAPLPTNLSTKTLGAGGVNSLFQMYYGRAATQPEKDYWSSKSDAQLRPALNVNTTTELAKRKQEATATTDSIAKAAADKAAADKAASDKAAADAAAKAAAAAKNVSTTLSTPPSTYVAPNTSSNSTYVAQTPTLTPVTQSKPVTPTPAPAPSAPAGIKRNLAGEQAFVKSWNGKLGRLPTSAEINTSVYGTASPKFS